MMRLYFVVILSAAFLAGCQGTVLTMHQVQMNVKTEPPAQRTEYYDGSSPSAFPFDYPCYRDDIIELCVIVGKYYLRFSATAQSQNEVEFLWGEALISSSEQPKPRALRTGYFYLDIPVTHELGSWPVSGYFAPPTVSIAQAEKRFGFQINVSELYAYPAMFGTQTMGYKQKGFIDTGIGRQLILQVPIRFNEQTTIYHFIFNATDVAQWRSYF